MLTKISEMPKIIIQNLFNKEIPYSTSENRTVINAIHSFGLDWMHSCGAKGKCTTCKFRVLEGMDNIGPETEAELRYRKLNRLNIDERLACQCSISDDIIIKVPQSGKMPHINYSE